MVTTPPVPDDSSPRDRLAQRGAAYPRLGLGLAVLATVWFAIDPFITDSRLPDPSSVSDQEWSRRWDALDEGRDQRQWLVVAAIGLALALTVTAMKWMPHRRRRIANAIGVCTVVWVVVVGFVFVFAPDGVPGGSVANQISASLGVVLLVAVGASVWARRAPEAQPVSYLRASGTIAWLGAVVAGLAAISAYVLNENLGTCGEPASTGQTALAAVAGLGGLAAVVLGIVATVMRRWFAGLVALVLGASAVLGVLIGALSCLE